MTHGKRIGLFGGTFNPIHCGHLNSVRETAAAFDLEEIHLIPSALPPHKDRQEIAAARHRLAMVKLAVAGMAEMDAVDLELTRQGLSYTVDTICHYQSMDRGGTRHFLIIGLDALLEINAWKSYQDIFRKIPIIVMYRPGILAKQELTPLSAMETYLQHEIDAGYTLAGSRATPRGTFAHPRFQPVHYLAVQPQPISATDIRRRVRRGLSLEGLVPPAVDDYIRSQGLYR